MLLHAIALLAPFLEPGQGQEPPPPATALHEHGDDFQEMVEHRAFPDLMKWKERYPWRVGTEVRKFILRTEDKRAVADPEIERACQVELAFLAEALADDTFTPWLMAYLEFDVETRAHFGTVREGLAHVAASIPKGGAAAILQEIDGLRPPVAPPWSFETCAEELTRIAGAAHEAGARDAAIAIAREAAAIADRTRDGEIAIWCLGFLGRASKESGDPRAAAQSFEKAIAIAWGADLLPESLDAPLALAEACGEELGDRGLVARASSLRAAIAEAKGSQRDALEHWKRSVAACEQLHESTRDTGTDEDPLRGGPDPYRRGILAAAKLGTAEEAWKIAALLRAGRGGKPFEATSLQADLAAKGFDALVVYVVGDEETVALTVHGKSCGVKVLPLGSGRIESLVGRLLSPMQLLRRGEVELAELSFDAKSARELHAALVDPILASLGARIAVLPDAALQDLPFEMLVANGEAKAGDPARPFAELSSLRFLLEDRAVAVLPSLTALTSRSDPRISSRWTVDDATLSAWTKILQPRLASKGRVIDAVREAKLELRKSEDPRGFPRAHPWFWAGWTVSLNP